MKPPRRLPGLGLAACLLFVTVREALPATPVRLFESAVAEPVRRERDRIAGDASSLRPGAALRFAGAAAVRAARPGDRWSMPGPDREPAEFTLVVESITTPAPDDVQVIARVEGEPGSAVLLALSGDRVALTVRRPAHEMIRIQPASRGLHRMDACRSEVGPRCGNEGGAALMVPAADDARRELAPATPGGGGVNTVDVAFLFTQAALDGAGGDAGMRALIALAVLESNDAFARSEALVRLRNVLVRQTDYVESGVLSTDLGRLSRAGDGWLDEAQWIRDEFAADVVCLVTESEDSNQFAGMANQLLETSAASMARGFTACLRPYLVGNYTLPHEVGHLMGCNHDRENATSGLEPWSHGTRLTIDGAVYRTVMAYRPGLQFPHFSNPRVRYLGVPTGVASGNGAADNVRTINLTAPLLAAVREPRVRVGLAREFLTVSESAGTVRVSFAWTGAATGGVFRIRTREATARAGVDFVPVDDEVWCPANGPPPDGFDLQVRDNLVADGPRRFAVDLVEPSAGLALGPVATLQVEVRDDEWEASALLDTSARVDPGADYLVSALLRQGDGVVAAGGFTTFGGLSCDRVARVRRDGTVDTNFHASVKYRVDALAELGNGRVALGGEFNTVNGERLNHVAVLLPDGRLDPGFAFDPGADLRVTALVPSGDGGLYAAGSFESVGDAVARRVVRLDATGAPVPEFDTSDGPDGDVFALAWDAGGEGREPALVAGGQFRTVAGVPHRGIVRLRADGAPDAAFSAGTGVIGVVRAVAVDEQGRVMIAGAFRQVGLIPAGGVARLLPSGAVDPSFHSEPGMNGTVWTLVRASAGGWWIGGSFTTAGGLARRHIARLLEDGRIDPEFDPGAGPDDWVLALTEDRGGTLWMGGLFRHVNGVPRGGLASMLTRAPRLPWFSEMTRAGADVIWRAKGATRQRYEVEAGTLGGAWQVVGSAAASESGELYGHRAADQGAEFLRLRRRLE